MKRVDVRGEESEDDVVDPPTHTEPSPDDYTVVDPEPWAAGMVVGERYEILNQIGKGGFSAVFRARDRVADEIVALKVLASHADADVVHLRREVQIARRISHPGVVRTHDLVQIGDKLVASMEFVEGETLSHRLKREPALTVDEVVRLADDIARALAAAHRVGVVHRDIKPGNIILRSQTGRAVIADFGISHVHSTEETPTRRKPLLAANDEGMVLGTPQYMAPEQLQGKEVGPPADVYAFGLVMYQAATGKRPFPGITVEQLASARTKGPIPALETERPEVPAALCQLIRRCLEPDPAQRPRDGEALKAALLEPAPKSERRRRWWWTAAAIVAAVGGGLGVAAFRSHPSAGGVRTFEVVADNRGSGADEWIQKPLARMASRKLEHTFLGTIPADDPRHADIVVALHYRRSRDGLDVDVDLANKPLATVHAASVADALDQATAQLAKQLHPAAPEATTAEKADMQTLGVHDVEAYRRYKVLVDDEFSAVLIDPEAEVRDQRTILKLEPHWAHAYADLVDIVGIGSPQGKEALAEAVRATTGTEQDPVGKKVLSAMGLIASGKLDDAAALLDPEFRAHPQDLHVGWVLARRVFHQAGRAQEAIAVYQKMYEQRPDLQFGSNLVDELRRAGRGREAAALIAEWVAKAPESEDARISQVTLDVENGRFDLAIQHAREQVFLFGDAPHRLANLCDVLIAAGENAEASALAQRMLRGSGPIRSRGWVRLGEIAAIEGRFSAALEAYEHAIEEGKPFATQSGLRMAYESMRWLSLLTGRTDEADRYDRELADYYRNSGLAWVAATVEFDRRLLHVAEDGCPDPEAMLSQLPEKTGVRLARVQMRRAAAGSGCLPCAEVVRDGISVDEASQRGLYQFGMCAAQQGELALARDAFVRAAQLRITSADPGTNPSEAHAILSHYQLARVLDQMGQKADAKQEYETFLAHWGQADRAVPEVDAARKAMAHFH
ncbi:MAG: protein kinase [Deltaproteobacteria bacterium]|nr:protein kinase [Deltaproteobacteria bacterium]